MPKTDHGRSRKPPSLRVISGGENAQRKATARRSRQAGDRDTKGKRVQLDLETWHALDMLGRDSMMTFQELADEAFRDLLRKHGRPVNLKDALKRSLGDSKPQQRKRSKESAPLPKK